MNAFRIQDIKFTGPLALGMIAMPFSISICNLAVGLLGISWITDGQWKEKGKLLISNPIFFLFAFFFLLHVVSIAYSTDKSVALFNLEKKILFLVLPFILATIKLKAEHVRFLLNVFIISCLTGTLICLWVAYRKIGQEFPNFNFDALNEMAFQSFNFKNGNVWELFSYTELASGIGIHPTYFSLYLTFCILIIIHLHAESFCEYNLLKKIIIVSTLLYLSVFVICLSSRIMTICLILTSIYGAIRFLWSASSIIKFSVISLVSAFLIGALLLNPVSRFRDYQEVVSTWPFLKPGLQTQSTTIRASLWSLSIKSIPNINVAIGTGIGDVEHLVQSTADDYGIRNILNTNDPHSQYLHTLLGLGVIGLLTLIACFGLSALVAYQKGNYFHLMFIGLFSILCLTESALEVQKGIFFFSLFNALFLFQPNHAVAYQFKELKA